MPFKISRTLFPKSTIEALRSIKNNSVVLKIYNQSNIEQFGMCTVRIRHKIARCSFIVVPEDSQVLLGMPDIELLDILKITYVVVGYQQADRKFNS